MLGCREQGVASPGVSHVRKGGAVGAERGPQHHVRSTRASRLRHLQLQARSSDTQVPSQGVRREASSLQYAHVQALCAKGMDVFLFRCSLGFCLMVIGRFFSWVRILVKKFTFHETAVCSESHGYWRCSGLDRVHLIRLRPDGVVVSVETDLLTQPDGCRLYLPYHHFEF